MSSPAAFAGQQAFDDIDSIVTGNEHLAAQPGLVYALSRQGATAQQASSINQFVGALDAQKTVVMARTSGSRIILSDTDKAQLDAIGETYDDVEFSQATAKNDAAAAYNTANQGVSQVKTDTQGNPMFDAQGNPVTVPIDPSKPHHGWFASGGDFFHHLLHNPVTNVVGEAGHLVQNTVATGGEPGIQAGINEVQDAQRQGYDPGNPFSLLAYKASGHSVLDQSSLVDDFNAANPSGFGGMDGNAALDAAEQLLKNPKAFRTSIETDPSLSPQQAAAKIQLLSSQPFQDFTKKVKDHSATFGDGLANAIYGDGNTPTLPGLNSGLIPGLSSRDSFAAGANLALSLAGGDPVVALGHINAEVKLAQIGIKSSAGFLDAEKAAALLTKPAGAGSIYLKRLQTGWQQAIDDTHAMAAAEASGDTTQAAKLMAGIQTRTPGLVSFMPRILGHDDVVGYSVVDGKAVAVFGKGAPIHDLVDAAEAMRDAGTLARLMQGTAGVESSVLPGAVSAYGLRALRSGVAATAAGRAASRTDKAVAQYITAAKADPDRLEQLITDGMLTRTLPAANDAVDARSGIVLASPAEDIPTESVLPSQARAASAAAGDDVSITPKGLGTVQFNLRRYGSATERNVSGWGSGTAIAARSRLAVQRLTSFLPRNDDIALDDVDAPQKVYRFGMTYLNRGDANRLAMAWVNGDAGARQNIIQGMLDQVGHAAGLPRTSAGRMLLDELKARTQAYNSVGDEATYNGQAIGLNGGEMQDTWTLPAFKDLYDASAKIGLYNATMGRALNSTVANGLTAQLKLGMLTKLSSVSRNVVEPWLKAAVDGFAGDAVRASVASHLSQRELWAMGHGLDSKAEYDGLLAAGDRKGAEAIARSNMMDTAVLGRSTMGNRIAKAAPVYLAGRAWRSVMGSELSPPAIREILDLAPEDLTDAMESISQQTLRSDTGVRASARDATDQARKGFGPAKIKYALNDARHRPDTPAPVAVDWGLGDTTPDTYAATLARKVNKTPGVAKAVIGRIEDPKANPLSSIVSELDTAGQEMRLSQYGKVYWRDGSDDALTARTADEVALGKSQWAQRLVDDHLGMYVGEDGQISKAVTDHVKTTGRAPDAEWLIKHTSGATRPAKTLTPEFQALAAGKERGFIQGLQDVEGAGFQYLVERPIRRLVTAPMFLADYGDAKVGLTPVKQQIIDSGVSEDAADDIVKRMALKTAMKRSEFRTDSPGQRAQMDVVGRNFFMFSRATTAMVRRWGTTFYHDPAAARKLMLTLEAGEHSGMIYNNDAGEPQFTFPASGVLQDALRDSIGKVPGFENMFRFPVSASFSGGVMLTVPGADAPFRYGLSPMVNIPYRALATLFPNQREMFDSVDQFVNGSLDAGRGPLEELTPSFLAQFTKAFSTDDRNSMLASSTVGALTALEAAGLTPKAGASSAEVSQYIDRVKTQTRNQLLLRFVFGQFSPTPISSPQENSAGTTADYLFRVQGIKNLEPEYLQILSEAGSVSRGNAIWTALHPDKSVYEVTHTQAAASGSALPATAGALDWLRANSGFVGKYKTLAAYFIPEAAQGGDFSSAAYHAELETGLRQRKTPQEFLTDVKVKNAESDYYPTIDSFDAAIAAATKNGATGQVSSLKNQKSLWSQWFKNMHPDFQTKLDNYPATRQAAYVKLDDLRSMLRGNEVPDGQSRVVQNMITMWDGYVKLKQEYPGSDTASVNVRKNGLAQLQGFLNQMAAASPLGANLYNGVFRVMDSGLDPLSGG